MPFLAAEAAGSTSCLLLLLKLFLLQLPDVSICRFWLQGQLAAAGEQQAALQAEQAAAAQRAAEQAAQLVALQQQLEGAAKEVEGLKAQVAERDAKVRKHGCGVTVLLQQGEDQQMVGKDRSRSSKQYWGTVR
jgi:hypothetical protein